MKLYFQFPQECKETELSNPGSPSRKFQRRPTNSRPSKHWQIWHPYLSSPAVPCRTPECDQKFVPSACCRPETLDLHRTRYGSLLTAIISHFDRHLLGNKLRLALCSIHILPISNKFHEFWWFEMFCRIMLRICKKQH